MKTSAFSSYGVQAAIEEINRRAFEEGEARLRDKMKPARLRPLDYGVAGPARLAASPAVIIELLGESDQQSAI